jgi:hypothetical protein
MQGQADDARGTQYAPKLSLGTRMGFVRSPAAGQLTSAGGVVTF